MKLYFPPLAQFAVFAAFGFFVSRLLPQLHIDFGGLFWVAIPLFLAGALILLAAVRSFGKAETTVNPIEPGRAESLVTNGLYRWTRNPMYLGMLLVMLGGMLVLQNAASFLGPILFVTSMTVLQIKPEERVLKQKFGEAYAQYAEQTRRWL